MKLIVQIPCFNEEHTLPATLADIPREIEGIDVIETLIIDDGSSDRTIAVAQELGVDHIIRNTANMGLARTFRHGLDACLAAGADLIVNTDGDNQYCGADIAKLVEPILAGTADIVIGNRQTATIEHFSPLKKLLQWLGSGVVGKLANVDVPDAVSGFRAISRDAAFKLNIVSSFSYTTEMVIQAGKRKIAIQSVPVRTNQVTRQSRLFQSIPQFLARSVSTMIRTYAMYQPLRMFFYIGTALSLVGALPAIRFLYFYLSGEGSGHIQSLIFSAVFLLMGFMAYMIGLLADLIAVNRQLLEATLERSKRAEWERDRTAGS